MCYVPPENSVYCNGTEEVYDELLLQIYTTINYDHVLIMGDFNARTGKLRDCCDIDYLPEWKVTDNTVNNHGKELINF